MRRARLTFEGAYHHVMNRGIRGESIFEKSKWKDIFIKIIQEKGKRLGINILAYCVMNNHYHIILQNRSGKLSQYMKDVNGQYGLIYRKIVGGKGYVFQNRYKSTLVQKDGYLGTVILYILLNPVRAGIVNNPYDYKWSSIQEYYRGFKSGVVDNEFVEGIYDSQEGFNKLLMEWLLIKELPITTTRFGDIFGDEEFRDYSIKTNNRRIEVEEGPNRRLDDIRCKDITELIREFEGEKGIEINDIDFKTKKGRRLRRELLLKLRDEGGIGYKEINQLIPFKGLKYSYLGRLYKVAKGEARRSKT